MTNALSHIEQQQAARESESSFLQPFINVLPIKIAKEQQKPEKPEKREHQRQSTATSFADIIRQKVSEKIAEKQKEQQQSTKKKPKAVIPDLLTFDDDVPKKVTERAEIPSMS